MDRYTKQRLNLLLFFVVVISLCSLSTVSFASAEQEATLTIGIVPQQRPKKIRKLWLPFLQQLKIDAGLKIKLVGSPDIPTFHRRVMAGKFDIIYTNPMSYITGHERASYEAIAKEIDKKLIGILVINKESEIKNIADLANRYVVFPKNAFAATTLTQRYLKKDNISVNPRYMHSHDEGYSLVALNKFDAAGGVMRTYNVLPATVRDKLKILIKFDGVTPHAFAVHPRVDKKQVLALQNALLKISDSNDGKDILKTLNLKSLEKAQDDDWDDVRKLMSQ